MVGNKNGDNNIRDIKLRLGACLKPVKEMFKASTKRNGIMESMRVGDNII